jgi:hypothetical protein
MISELLVDTVLWLRISGAGSCSPTATLRCRAAVTSVLPEGQVIVPHGANSKGLFEGALPLVEQCASTAQGSLQPTHIAGSLDGAQRATFHVSLPQTNGLLVDPLRANAVRILRTTVLSLQTTLEFVLILSSTVSCNCSGIYSSREASRSPDNSVRHAVHPPTMGLSLDDCTTSSLYEV